MLKKTTVKTGYIERAHFTSNSTSEELEPDASSCPSALKAKQETESS